MTKSGGLREALRGILFFFLYPVYIPYLISRWLLKLIYPHPLYRAIRVIYVKSIGSVKMKLGLWQPIGYFPAGSHKKYDYVPRWVRKATREQADKKLNKQVIDLNGRSFQYRVKSHKVDHPHPHATQANTRYYRKLKTPLHRRAVSKTNPDAVSRRGLLGLVTAGATGSLLTWMAVDENPPVSANMDIDARNVDIPILKENTQTGTDNTTPDGTDGDAEPTVSAWEPEEAAREAHKAVNAERVAAGRSKLAWRDDVASAAGIYANRLAKADRLTHTLYGTRPEDRYRRLDITEYNGENAHQIWWKQRMTTAQEIDYIDSADDLGQFVVASWMDSEGHRENILRGTNEAEGIGIVKNDSGAVYVVQVFTR